MDLRWEFANRGWLERMGDVEDFLEWTGIDAPIFSNDPEWFKTLPVFERLGLKFHLSKFRRSTYLWQANIWTAKETSFFKRGASITGQRRLGKGDAVLSSLLALWELETHRKVDVVKRAFGITHLDRAIKFLEGGV